MENFEIPSSTTPITSSEISPIQSIPPGESQAPEVKTLATETGPSTRRNPAILRRRGSSTNSSSSGFKRSNFEFAQNSKNFEAASTTISSNTDFRPNYPEKQEIITKVNLSTNQDNPLNTGSRPIKEGFQANEGWQKFVANCDPDLVITAVYSPNHPRPTSSQAPLASSRRLSWNNDGDTQQAYRKKPRKQQLGHIDAELPQIIPKVQKRRLSGCELLLNAALQQTDKQEPLISKINYTFKRPRLSLLDYDKLRIKRGSLPRNHFLKDTEVPPELIMMEETEAPTLATFAARPGILKQLERRDLELLANNFTGSIEEEECTFQDFSRLLKKFEACKNTSVTENLNELLKTNMQKFKVLKEDLITARTDLSEILQVHKPIVTDLLTNASKEK